MRQRLFMGCFISLKKNGFRTTIRRQVDRYDCTLMSKKIKNKSTLNFKKIFFGNSEEVQIAPQKIYHRMLHIKTFQYFLQINGLWSSGKFSSEFDNGCLILAAITHECIPRSNLLLQVIRKVRYIYFCRLIQNLLF